MIDGSVPNVVHSCGALVEGRRMLLPYAVADSFTGIATLSVDDLLGMME
ncbi:MAG: glycosidase [Sphingomonas bacterium]|nr:glycosidase [Sphingomonas bacterium]